MLIIPSDQIASTFNSQPLLQAPSPFPPIGAYGEDDYGEGEKEEDNAS